jgi:hypothetical protein
VHEANPNRKEKEMRTGGHTLRGHEMVLPTLELDGVREWAKRVFTKDRMVAVALSGSTLAVLGAVLFALYGAMEANTVVAPSTYLASMNWQPSVPAF